MLDIHLLRTDPQTLADRLSKRGTKYDFSEVLALDEKARAAITKLQDIQTERNALSKEIGTLKQTGKAAEADAVMKKVADMKQAMTDLELERDKHLEQLNTLLLSLPNVPADDVPIGADEHGNIIVDQWGTPPKLATPREHDDIGVDLGMMHPEIGVKISGSRFMVMTGDLARMERALGQFMIDMQTQQFGYTEVSVPLLVKEDAMYGTAQLPKFREDQFGTTNGMWLIPTAEVSLTNMVREQIVEAEDLPMRLTALTPCFRAEAGSAGQDTKGMIRQHQFWKVEMVSIVTPEQEQAEHERMTRNAKIILEKLGLAYRTMLPCTGDMGFASRKTYDLEVWLPSQNKYREISSCSMCGDFQARRMKARFKHKGDKHTNFVHTLNGSGLAVGRTLVAILENYVQPDGSVLIPEALRPYMGGQERITKHVSK